MRRLGDFLICVRERHDTGGEAVNEIVAIPVDGSGEPQVLVSGPDFVANPRLSPSGHAAGVDPVGPPEHAVGLHRAVRSGHRGRRRRGPPRRARRGRRRTGGVGDPAGVPGRRRAPLPVRPRHRLVERLRRPRRRHRSRPGRASRRRSARRSGSSACPGTGSSPTGGWCSPTRARASTTSPCSGSTGRSPTWTCPYTEIASVAVRQTSVVFVGAGFDREAVVVEVPIEGDVNAPVAGEPEVLRPARDLGLDPAWFSVAQPVSFPSGPNGERTAHALYYPPTNPDVEAPEGEAPPLLVLIHGGPTAMARGRLDLAKQYWTSRGFALVDVNYGGSTGYGRAVPGAAAGQLGHRRRRGLHRGRHPPGRAGPRRPGPALHPGRLGRRVHRARRAGAVRRLRRRRVVLRRRRPDGAGRGDPQVRVPLPRRPGRPVPRGEGGLRRAVADQPHRPARVAAHRVPGPRGRDRPAEPVRDGGRGAAGARASPSSTTPSRASSTASGSPRR